MLISLTLFIGFMQLNRFKYHFAIFEILFEANFTDFGAKHNLCAHSHRRFKHKLFQQITT